MKKITCIVAFLVMVACAYAQEPTVEHMGATDTEYVLSARSFSFNKVISHSDVVVTTTYRTLDSNIAIPSQVSEEDARRAIEEGPQKLHMKRAPHEHWYWFLVENQMETYDELSFDGKKFVYLPGQKISIFDPSKPSSFLAWWAFIGLMLISTFGLSWFCETYLFTIFMATTVFAASLVAYSVNMDYSTGISVWIQCAPFALLLLVAASIGTYIGYRVRRRTTLKRSSKNLALT